MNCGRYNKDMDHARVLYPCNPYDEQGVDITLIKQLLALSPADRLRHMERCARDTKLLLNMADDTGKPSLLRIADILHSHGAEFVVIGGQAAVARFTATDL